MKIKGNWAFGITASYIIFTGFLIWFMIFSSFHSIDLVEEDYYDKEIAFQSQIEKVKRTRALPQQLAAAYDSGLVTLRFPAQFTGSKIGGSISLYRPSDASLNVEIPIHADEQLRVIVPVSRLEKGLWKMKIEWEVDGVGYFNEHVFVF